MIEIGIYIEGQPYLESVGKGFLNENIKDVTFTLVRQGMNFKGDVLVVCEGSLFIYKDMKVIVLKEEEEDGGIFLFQRKDILLEAIIKEASGVPQMLKKLKVVGAFSFDNPGKASYFNYFLSSLLGSLKARVCFLSFNPFFPYEKAYPITHKGALSKLLYYLEAKEKIEGSIFSHHPYGFDFVEPPLDPKDMVHFKAAGLPFLESQLMDLSYDYLVLDLYNLSNSIDYLNYFETIYYLGNPDCAIEDKGLVFLNKNRPLEGGGIENIRLLDDDFVVEGLDQLMISERSKTYHLWKKKLSKGL